MKKASAVVLGLFLLLYILPLGKRAMFSPDEFRYAEISREMIASGDWIVPHLDGLRYFEKPVMGYWLNAVSMKLFGENAFAIRFSAAMAAGLTALMLFFLVKSFAGGYWAGLLTAGIFLSCFEVYGIGTYCVIDSQFSMFLTGTLVSFFFAYKHLNTRQSIYFLIASGVFCGFAFLTKGFLAFAITCLIILPFIIWEHRLKDVLKVAWIPVIAIIIVSLPWALMIYYKEPDFWHYFFWVENIKRFASTDAQHAAPFWYYIPVILSGALPWTVVFPSSIMGLKGKDLKDPFLRFFICWLFFPFIFFSLSHGKLLTYILPCFPPIAVLTAVGILKYFKPGRTTRLFSISVWCFGIFISIVAGIFVVNQMTGLINMNAYIRLEAIDCIVLITGMVIWSLCCILSGLAFDTRKKILLYFIGPLLFMFSINFVINNIIKTKKAPGLFLMHNSKRIESDTIIAADFINRAVCWCYKRDDVYLLDRKGELDYGLGYEDAMHRFITLDKFKDIINNVHEKKKVVLIARMKDYLQYKPHLPKPVFEDISGRLVFIEY